MSDNFSSDLVDTFTVIYKDSETVDETKYMADDKATIKDYEGENEDTFLGWAVRENGEVEYKAGDSIVITENVVLYPVFEKKEVSYGNAEEINSTEDVYNSDIEKTEETSDDEDLNISDSDKDDASDNAQTDEAVEDSANNASSNTAESPNTELE